MLKRAMGGRVGSFEWMDGVGRAEWVGGRWRAGGEERQGCARTQSSSRQCYTSWLKCDLCMGGGELGSAELLELRFFSPSRRTDRMLS